MKWLIVFFLLLIPVTSVAQEEPYQRPAGKILTINDEPGIFFTKQEFETWAKIYVDYRKLYDQKILTDKLELKLTQIGDLYAANLSSCELRFKTMENSVTYWQTRADSEKDARFKMLKSVKLETTLYQIGLGVETAAYVATVLALVLR